MSPLKARSKNLRGSKAIRKMDARSRQLNNRSSIAIVPSREVNTAKKTDELSAQSENRDSAEDKQNNTVLEESSAKDGNVDEFEVQIWLPASSVSTRVITEGTAGTSSWLRVSGSGCKATEVQVTAVETPRPRTAPPTVKRLQLTPRPSLQKYRVKTPALGRLSLRKTKPKPRTAVSIQPKEKMEKPMEHKTESVCKEQRVMASTRAEERRRRAEAKRRAENEFRSLLQLDEGLSLRNPPYLIPSSVPDLPATVCFKGLPSEKKSRGLQALTGQKLFVHYGGPASTPVRLAFLKAGFGVSKSPTVWNVLWGCSPKKSTFETMTKYQRVNHFPGSSELGRKDKLYRNFARLQSRHGDEFDFIPRCFVLPEQRVELRQELAKNKQRRYIIKPAASSCGRGIRITSNPSVFTCAKECIVQRYIQKPMTINGFKFDLRVYVGVTSFSPLRVYVYEDGLVRFATESYTTGKSDLDNRYIHITNTSVNKKKENYVKNQDAEKPDIGSKWSLKAFRSYITRHRLADWGGIWTQVREIVAKTFICVESPMMEHIHESEVPNSQSCFEVFGFDILLDANHRAWLLEVNTSPDLSASSPLDHKLKTELVEDMLHLVGIVPGTRRRRKSATRRQFNRPWTHASHICVQLLAREELNRGGGWEAVIPNLQEPFRYQNLFETLRDTNLSYWESIL